MQHQQPINIDMSTIKNKLAKIKIKNLLIILSAITVFLVAFNIYVGLIKFSLYDTGFRMFIILLLLIWSIPLLVCLCAKGVEQGESAGFKAVFKSVKASYVVPFALFLAVALFFSVISIASMEIFNATAYRDRIYVEENISFTDNIVNHTDMLVPIVDKSLAYNLGDKKLGENNLGSQYEIYDYSLSYYNGDIYWIGVIEYSGFFKWADNYQVGSPGYVRISATKDPYEVILVEYPIKYIESAYFAQDRDRVSYFAGNMNKVLSSSINAELDDDGNLMFVRSVIEKTIMFSGAEDTVGVIITNPATGENNYYDVGEEPAWVDRVHATEVVIDQLDSWGQYIYGYWNTVFAKKEVMLSSEGYAYVANEDDDGNVNIYLYTGMTSVGTDESMVGVVLVNLKTKESFMFNSSGATEYAAMQSAEGVVQDLGYTASWPLLLNYEGEPTYLITLKDASGLVKSYAYVNLKDFSIVGYGSSILLARADYESKITLGESQEEQELSLTIKQAVSVQENGNTYYLIKFNEAEYSGIYKMLYSVNEEILFIDNLVGVSVSVTISGSNITILEFAE